MILIYILGIYLDGLSSLMLLIKVRWKRRKNKNGCGYSIIKGDFFPGLKSVGAGSWGGAAIRQLLQTRSVWLFNGVEALVNGVRGM